MRHFQKGGPLDNCKKGGARGDRLIRLTQYPPLVRPMLNDLVFSSLFVLAITSIKKIGLPKLYSLHRLTFRSPKKRLGNTALDAN